jgi:hypothetical protein
MNYVYINMDIVFLACQRHNAGNVGLPRRSVPIAY